MLLFKDVKKLSNICNCSFSSALWPIVSQISSFRAEYSILMNIQSCVKDKDNVCSQVCVWSSSCSLNPCPQKSGETVTLSFFGDGWCVLTVPCLTLSNPFTRRVLLTGWGVVTIVVGAFIFGQSTTKAVMELFYEFWFSSAILNPSSKSPPSTAAESPPSTPAELHIKGLQWDMVFLNVLCVSTYDLDCKCNHFYTPTLLLHSFFCMFCLSCLFL